MTAARITLRRATRLDLAALVQIERASFPPAEAWSESVWSHVLSRGSGLVTALALTPAPSKVGFVVFEATRREIDVINLAVDPDHRRRGIGTQMIEALRRRLRPVGRTCITAMVREGNLAAQLFFHRQRFELAATVRGAYGAGEDREDGYEMEYSLRGSWHLDRLEAASRLPRTLSAGEESP